MQINKIQQNNQPNFGIKYLNKKAWNNDVLKAFENSKLLKGIDKKYPEAEVYYIKISENESLINTELVHTLVTDIKLAKDKFFRWNLSSYSENVPEKHFIKDLSKMTLEDVENRSAKKLSPLSSIEITIDNKKSKNENEIINFLRKIFS